MGNSSSLPFQGSIAEPTSQAVACAAAADRGGLAWNLLFGALCMAAGHGLVLVLALGALYGWPNLRELGGTRSVAAVAWFAVSIPLAPLALLARKRLERSSRIVPLAIAIVALTLFAFLSYGQRVVSG
jgi:hypothetical protein